MEFSIQTDTKSIIRVIGVGGAGGNAVSNMYESGIKGVDFAICNTDNQDLEESPVPTKIQLGPKLTAGLGAGNKAVTGREACLESIEDIRTYLQDNTKMLFLTAGLGGGTGTGATPIIAGVAQELGILTIGIVTLPFSFEGPSRMNQAATGLEELRKSVDALIVISNDKLRETYGNMSMRAALAKADEVLTTSAKGIAEIITLNGNINIDFNDVDTVMRNSGVAILGTGVAEGEERARRAVDGVLNAPLLADNEIKGAKDVLINIVSGQKEATLDEITEISNYIQNEAGFETNVIWGNVYDETLEDEISVTVIATGFDRSTEYLPKTASQNADKPIYISLEDTKKDNIDAMLGSEQVKTTDKEEEELVAKKEAYESKEETGNTLTLNFKTRTSQEELDKLNHSRASYGDPYVKKSSEDEAPKVKKVIKKKVQDRARQQERKTKRITNAETLHELESVPAYERRKIELDEVDLEGNKILSNLTLLGDDDEVEVVTENSYLHKRVD